MRHFFLKTTAIDRRLRHCYRSPLDFLSLPRFRIPSGGMRRAMLPSPDPSSSVSRRAYAGRRYVPILLGATTILGATVYAAFLATDTSWKYYVTADECVAELVALRGSRVRVSGVVETGTLDVNGERSRAAFKLRGRKELLETVCTGTLPDNLQEGMEVVVEGYLQRDGSLCGDKVLTKCASKYDEAGEQGTNVARRRADRNL